LLLATLHGTVPILHGTNLALRASTWARFWLQFFVVRAPLAIFSLFAAAARSFYCYYYYY
jgi:hypothetical protein